MAKLNKKKAEEAASASNSFDPIADGAYHFVLKEVDATREGPKGPYWSWEYECIEEEPATLIVLDADGKPTGEEKTASIRGRREWNNTSLAQAWSLKQTFDAYGVPPDTDTDELIGRPVKLVLELTTIQSGNRKGQLSNNVTRVQPADDEIKALVDKRAADAKEMSEIF